MPHTAPGSVGRDVLYALGLYGNLGFIMVGYYYRSIRPKH